MRQYRLIRWRKRVIAFVVGIILLYLFLVMFSFVLDFESSNIEAELTGFAPGHCAARGLNAVMGSLFSRSPLSKKIRILPNACCWILVPENKWLDLIDFKRSAAVIIISRFLYASHAP